MDAADTIEIHQLLGQYGHLIDAQDWDAFARLFTVDAVMDYTHVRAPKVFNGIDEILEYFRGANHPSAHHVTNIVVAAADDGDLRVRVHSKFIVPFTRPTHSPQRWYGGDYHDIVTKTADGWKFSEKVCIGRWQFTPETDDNDVPKYRRTF